MLFWEILFLILLCAVIISRLRARLYRWLARPANKLVEVEKCRCGYSLRGLPVLRCPECGRVVGFDATAEELTLTREELERAQVVRQQRLKAAGTPEIRNPIEIQNPNPDTRLPLK